jgi:predicted O-methyltransferase YrrM
MIRPDIYLELGLYEGETFNKVRPFCRRAIGVDIVKKDFDGEIYTCTTTEFFEDTALSNINMCFIDADHSYASVTEDFHNVAERLAPGGIIILHDTDPAADNLIDPGYCGDSYRIVNDLEKDDMWNIITLPSSIQGLSLVMRKQETRKHLRG